MANEVLVGLKIGAAVSGTLHAAFGSARSTVQQLGRATDLLRGQQTRMGAALATALAQGGSGVGKLRRQYEQVGQTIEQLRLKQERLNTSIARGEALKEHRADLRGQVMETAGTAAVLGAPVVQAVRTSIEFQDQLRDISITAGFDSSEEAKLGKMIRGAALSSNQTQTDINSGVGKLVSGGISDLIALQQYTPVMAEVATATRSSMDDLGNSTIALRDSMKIGASDYKATMNMLVAGGKAGQFEMRDMAKWLPEMASQYGAMGQTGREAVAELTAALQVARMGAGSSDEAANNYKNFLAKLTAPDTIKAFDDVGIDLKASMKRLANEGLSPMKSMLELVTQHLGSKGPAAAAEYKQALDIKDSQEREMALQRLDEAYKLGELFRDQQVLSFIRPALANRDKMAEIEAKAIAAADQDVIGQDFAKRTEIASEQLKSLRINLTEAGISVGSVLLPALVDVTRAVVPLIQQFATWAGENPALVKGVVGLVTGLLVGKLAFLGVAYGANLAIAPLVGMTTTITGLSAKWTLLRAMWQAGKFLPLITGLTKVGGGLLTVLRYSGLFLRGFGMAFGAPLMLAGRGLLMLGGVLGGSLLNGLRLAGQAVLWLGRALLLNPIGLLITGIAVAAFLIYRYWEPIKGFFSGLWTEIKAGFSGGLAGILGLLVNFSPLGLFYRAFAGVMSYFGIELPGKFSEFGSMVISGLVNGMTAKLSAARDTVVSFGNSIKGWFTETLGIHSPSRVFMGYGANVGEGAAIGISGSEGLVRKAALGMAAATAVNFAAPNLAAATAVPGAAGMAGSGIVIHYAPQITVQGGGPGTQEAVQQALQLSRNDLEKMMREVLADQQRRAF
ncbi:MAG: phage tail tape measure protein [Aquipseudomonas alcaligenes]|uniref:Phage tail tape measure protein n=1 Tax=Aquipseudomonas alcaligenes TaxID=43263 RepID=A0A5C7W8Q3_AQUAC|nr:MAG: phage tail tape measure protein [Pseudomonas alcaligenes]